MENIQNEKNLQHEKLRLHIKYIIVICSIICIGTIIITSYNQDAFVSQVSFAGTITSIVLSVIAIWLSISGERSTNDIRIKIAESTERLSDTTKKVKSLNKSYENTMDTQLNELKNVQEQLTKVISSVNSVGEQVSHLEKQNVSISNTIDNNIFNTNQRIALFNNTYTWVANSAPDLEYVFCKTVHIFITLYNKNRTECNLNNIIFYLSQENVNTNYLIRPIDTYWGILNTLLAASVFDDEVAVTKIVDKVNSKIKPVFSGSVK